MPCWPEKGEAAAEATFEKLLESRLTGHASEGRLAKELAAIRAHLEPSHSVPEVQNGQVLAPSQKRRAAVSTQFGQGVRGPVAVCRMQGHM